KNISIGRLIIFEEIISSDFPESVRTQWILEVTRFFDLFLYYVTGAYNELKESIINDKNRFIQQMHSDRLTILGQIAASFAHEFRNPLTSIKGFMALIERRIKADQKTDYYFSIIKREMQGLEEKVTRFLFLSKMKGLDDREETIRLNDLLRETVEFLYPRFLSEGIEVIIDIEPVKMLVSGVTEQLKQVFLNILNNAVEELSQLQDLKKIFLTAKQKGDQIYIRIANNGQKIEDHLLDNIFEPFISTKELGTGLGLAVCKQIIEKHDGKITVTSTDEETAFHLELPNKKD
ncbi:MAG TPA: ATP-binding protein, partial [Bacillales bacterium]|nr:ATP-binding protein [Bacillales bacterium]